MYHIFIVSDGTGRTAEQALNAALTQFHGAKLKIIRRPKVRSIHKVREIVEEAKEVKGFIVHTLVTDKLRGLMVNYARKQNVENFDLMGPFLARLSEQLAISPAEKPGLFGQLNKEYFRRIATMEFAIQHDDGLRIDEIKKAEIVLIGVSRTFKTPLSIYLAFKGWFVANVPILLESIPPEILYNISPSKVFCLDTNPRQLAALRRSRYTYLHGSTEDYVDQELVRIELMNARKYFNTQPAWRIINVVNRSIEEIASEIIALRGEKK